jgi:hypothetical protein
MSNQDKPTCLHPAVIRELELEAIRLYRAAYPDAPPWQDLDSSTQVLWVYHAERASKATGEGA